MERGRAYRRHQRRRAWCKMERIVREVWREQYAPCNYSDEHVTQVVRYRFKNRAVCSCWMCGNPRHSWVTDKLTVQELRAAIDARQQLGEL